jgi:hypothetical protein
MSRFSDWLKRADLKVDRVFAESEPVILVIGAEQRPVTAIFESPDAPVEINGGGEISDHAPALSLYTADIHGLEKRHAVIIGTQSYWVTHIGADEDGRSRVTLAVGAPNKPAKPINKWS